MFEAKYEIEIQLENIPIQWLPKIEIYYPDLPQFPIMYIHSWFEGKRIFAFPGAVSYDIKGSVCNGKFHVLCNVEPNEGITDFLKSEIEERIGLSDPITKDIAVQTCNGDKQYENFMSDLWQYIADSYGESIPYGRYYEEIYSISRFVSAWQPKTGRQSEMRMLYNFMSAFGEEVSLPKRWEHLECYTIPNLQDVSSKEISDFEKFQILDSAMRKVFEHEFSKNVTISGTDFRVMPKAWKQNKDVFIRLVSLPMYQNGVLTEEERFSIERLVDAFNRHAWRAAYYISSYMTIDKDYNSWSKEFFMDVYSRGNKLKGYSEKVIACFLQQGFKKEEIIPIDTWIETFYMYPLGIDNRQEFYSKFCLMGKLERIIWLASQANKTNMKNFFDLLWCQRYGTIGNEDFRGINPIACSECKLKNTCVGLKNNDDSTICLLEESKQCIIEDGILKLKDDVDVSDTKYICVLENGVPRKVFIKDKKKKAKNFTWKLTDEFSGYILTSKAKLPEEMIAKKYVLMKDYIKLYK